MHPNVRQYTALQSLFCWAASFPSLRRFLRSSLCAIAVLWDLISSCTHRYATSMCCNFPIPCLWRMCSVAFALMVSTGFTAKPKTNIMLWTPFASDAPNAAAYSSVSALPFCNDLLLAWVFPASARLCSTTFDSPRNRPSPNPWKLSAPWPVLHIQTLVPTVSRVSNTWQVFVAWQGSVDWHSTSFDTARSQWMSCLLDLDWGTNIWQPVTCTCDADPDSKDLTLPLLSRRVLLVVCTELPCSSPRSFTSRSTCLGSCWYTIPRFRQCNLLFNVLMLSDDPQPMTFALMGYTFVIFLSNSINFFVGPVSTKSKSPILNVLLPIAFPTAGCVPRSVHALLHQSYFPSVSAILPSTGSRVSTGLWAFAWKYARDTSMCMIENVSFLFAAIDDIAFNASNGRVPVYKSGRSSLSNSLAHIRDQICMVSSWNALSVSTHFVSTGVIPCFATASFSSTFSYTPRLSTYFNSSSRALRTACHGSSLPMMSSKHMTSCSCLLPHLPTSRVLHGCVSRGLLYRLYFSLTLAPHLLVNLAIFQLF